MSDWFIRPFETFEDHVQSLRVQRAIWSNDLPVPPHISLAIVRRGGVALGAFTAQGEMIGCVLSFLGWSRYGLCHHSHFAAVVEGWRDKGIGEALKQAQRRAVLAQGIRLITWTYDPLQARNARLNIGKLRAICRTYIRDAYGPDPSGLPTDRFEVEWWLDEDPRRPGLTMEIPIPLNFQALRESNPEQALSLRMRARQQFEQAFAEGFVVTDFAVRSDQGVYTLTQFDAPNKSTGANQPEG
ncbi:MAG: hypothetical protein RMM31_06100 [Anaerolineae bacterium]|nr:hypothetical protein [Thermoflexales bacterium]MDW8395793.1 hypothetical protein [Anaerolineae bacterium]